MRSITILLPAYNEAEQLPKTLDEIPKHIPQNYDYQLLFVDDGSSDDSWQLLSREAALDPHIRAIRFSRNFGKEAAIVAGLLEAEGDAVIVMDCDLQHPPRYLPEFLSYWEQGYQIVEAVKEERQRESKLKRWAANSYYKLFHRLTGLDLSNASDYKLLDRQVVDVWRQMPERANFFRAQSAWVGFKHKSFPFQVDARTSGESRWSTAKLTRLAMDSITGFSAKPLLWISGLGAIFMVFFLIMAIISLVQKFSGRAADGFTTVILLQLLIGGSTLFSLGLLGIYLERIFAEVKGRPRYLVADRLGDRKTHDTQNKHEPGSAN